MMDALHLTDLMHMLRVIDFMSAFYLTGWAQAHRLRSSQRQRSRGMLAALCIAFLPPLRSSLARL